MLKISAYEIEYEDEDGDRLRIDSDEENHDDSLIFTTRGNPLLQREDIEKIQYALLNFLNTGYFDKEG